LTPSIYIKEYPPLALSTQVETPDGKFYRWGPDGPTPEDTTSALSFGTVMPGGFDQASVTLQRNPQREWPDISELSTVRFHGKGGREVAWEGRLESAPDQAGDQMSITPGLVGWQSHLDDDSTARMIYVDGNLSTWSSPTVTRQLYLQTISPSGEVNTPGTNPSPPLAPGDTSSEVASALDLALEGPWDGVSWCEGLYDALGIPIDKIWYAFIIDTTTMNGTDGNWNLTIGFSDQNVDSYVDSGDIFAASGQGLLQNTADWKFAFVQQSYGAAAGGDGVSYNIYFTCLCVYGQHGLPLQGTPGATAGYGLLSSDIEGHAVSTWAPKIGFTTGPNGSIQASTFVIPQLTFTDPGTASAIIKGAVAFELRDWAVWEGPTYYSNAYGARGNQWRVRTRDSLLQDAGPDITRLCNGVIVDYTDVTGVTRTVGPPGTNCDLTDSRLVDPDPQNPANEVGINRYLSLSMGTTGTAGGAIQIGLTYLQQQALIVTAGSATITGYCLDSKGVLWPAWRIRAGDSISFIDAADTSYRRIVSTNYDDPSKANTLQLDQPPDSLTAILERLQVAIGPIVGG
jgi:hypothetical protein